MNSTYQAYPLSWPIGRQRTKNRQHARFSHARSEITIDKAVRRVMQEVRAFTRTGKEWVIDPDSVVISNNVPVKRDGTPYSVYRAVDDPGAAIYFKMRGKDYCLSCDRWTTVAANIAAVAKHLEAMRGMDRWGVGNIEAAFAGYKALPGGDAIITPAPMTVEEAADFLATMAGFAVRSLVMKDREAFQSAYRHAAKKLHPDANNGKASQDWITLQRAQSKC